MSQPNDLPVLLDDDLPDGFDPDEIGDDCTSPDDEKDK